MQSKIRLALVILIFCFVIGLISADFSVENTSIKQRYSKEENLSGWVNIKFNSEKINSNFKDSLENSFTLEELLNSEDNSDFDYNCSIEGCSPSKEVFNPENEKKFNVNSDVKKVALKFDGMINSIDKINFFIESDAKASCESQLLIDLFDDGSIDLINKEYQTSFCGQMYGCFNFSQTTESAEIKENAPLCQRIKLPKAPAFNLGALINEKDEGEGEIIFELYDLNGNKLDFCELNKSLISNEEEYSCVVDYLNAKEKEHYVCVSSSGEGVYKTKAYVGNKSLCGFYGVPSGSNEEISSYSIFAKSKKFDDFGRLNISESLSDEVSLSHIIENYIFEEYGGDCSDECIVPIKITSTTPQEFSLKNLTIEYDKEGIPGAESNSFYDLEKAYPEINSKTQKFYLDGFFEIGSKNEEINYSLNLSDKKILSETIKIIEGGEILALFPGEIPVNYETTLKVVVDNSTKIEEYRWIFENETQETTKPSLSYYFDKQGNQSLKIEVINEKGSIYSKTFNLEIGPADSVVNKTIEEKIQRIQKIKSDLEEFEYSEREKIKEIISLDKKEDRLKEIESDFLTSSDKDYENILNELDNLKIPTSVLPSKVGRGLPYFNEEKNINVNYLETIKEMGYKSDTDYEDLIKKYSQSNLDIKVDYKKIEINYDQSEEEFLTIFDFKFGNLSEEVYFIIEDMPNLNISDSDFNHREDFSYKKIEGGEEINLFLKEDIEIENLPAFISPGFEELNSLKAPDVKPYQRDKTGWVLIFLVLFFILIAAFFVYAILHRWYKRRYEDYLFKNKNDLYNLATFIKKSKNSGMTENEIKNKLKEAGWSSEQVRYIIKKYLGKKTGMKRLPFQDIFDKIIDFFEEKFANKNKGKKKKSRFKPKFNRKKFSQKFNKY